MGLAAPAQAAPTRQLKVATYNIDEGTDFPGLLTAPTCAEFTRRAGLDYDQMVATDFPSRAQAISRLFRREHPEVAGLQEVALWQKGPLNGSLHTTYDFLTILLRALREHGLHYHAAVINTIGTATVPISATEKASYTDRNVILVEDGLPVTNPQSHLYAAKLVVPTACGVPFTLRNGWSTVDVSLAKGNANDRSETVRVANTHLNASVPTIRNAQANELHAALAQSPYPVAAVGDFNSLPTESPYLTFTSGGYDDAWKVVHGPGDGFTALQDPNLRNLPSKLDHRIDYVFYQPPRLSAVVAKVIGDRANERTPNGLWPSDHAGVSVSMHLSTTKAGSPAGNQPWAVSLLWLT
ncbi:endonuclease/exonuclease/phosphatase family protein [Streptomyces sp. CoH27]|uniref:endonuclease/exonuclease/phosphatase family protein n=1 Tax=Streptomyces sp. CoH27 TaxID=2875763 RepID=UPI001CD435B1|nr:endonuclease/exonuclease/phosphatase family protein [Streptomyces sp. CoH27]